MHLFSVVTLQQHALEQTLIDDNWYSASVKMELIPHKQYQMNPLKFRNFPSKNQGPAPYLGSQISGYVQSPDTL